MLNCCRRRRPKARRANSGHRPAQIIGYQNNLKSHGFAALPAQEQAIIQANFPNAADQQAIVSALASASVSSSSQNFSGMLKQVASSSNTVSSDLAMGTTALTGGGAGNLSFNGSTSFQTNPPSGTVSIAVPKIVDNSSAGSTSGTVRVQLWFFNAPYSGGSQTGYDVANVTNYGTLAGGGSYYNSQTVPVGYTAPPSGTYYAALLLQEDTSSGYVTDNYIDYSPVAVGGGGGSSGSAVSVAGMHTQYNIVNDNGSLYIQDLVATGNAEEVARLYQAALGRAPDVGGLDGWTAQLNAHALGIDQVALGFINSAEFSSKYGALDNADFVTQLYQKGTKQQRAAT